jgi:UDP-glucose 4-epimerase
VSPLKGTRALVIGGLGFIGVNLTRQLAAEGARVTVLTPSRERHAEQIKSVECAGVRVVDGDLRDRTLMAGLVGDQALVFNLSGQSGAVASMEDPWTDLDVNCRGNLVLLEALRERNPLAKVVFAGSRLQYGRQDTQPVIEDAPTNPLCLHAIHKQTVEQYLRLYSRLFGLRYAVARITNPYGPGQPAGRTAYGVINRLVQLALAGEPLTIYGDGRQQRDYIHVDDVVGALVALAASPVTDGRAYNVGCGVGTSLAEVAELIIEMAGRGQLVHVPWPALAEQIETGDFVADVSRIRQDVGWAPTTPLRSGLETTVDHYRAQGGEL